MEYDVLLFLVKSRRENISVCSFHLKLLSIGYFHGGLVLEYAWFCLEHVLRGFASIKNARWLLHAGDASKLICWRMYYYGAMLYGKCCYKPSSYFHFFATNVKILMASSCVVVDSHGNIQLVLSLDSILQQRNLWVWEKIECEVLITDVCFGKNK